MNKIIIIIGLVGIAIYVSAFVVAAWAQKSLIYPVPRQANEDCDQAIPTDVITRNNTKLYHHYAENSDKVVVFYHGNGDKVCDKIGLIDIFNEHNISYIFPEYEGYNNDGIKASSDGILRSVQDTVDYLDEQNYEQVYVIGQSIGSGAASFHTSLQTPERLLLISPFTTLTNVVDNMFPIYPRFLIEKFVDDKFNNKERLREYSGALTIVHGSKDPVIPDMQGRELLEISPAKYKKFITAVGYGHKNIYESIEMNEAIKEIIR